MLSQLLILIHVNHRYIQNSYSKQKKVQELSVLHYSVNLILTKF